MKNIHIKTQHDLIDNCYNHFPEGAYRDVNGNITFDAFNCCDMYHEYALQFSRDFGIQHEVNYIFWGHRRLKPPPRDISAPRVYISHYAILRSFDDQVIPLTEDVAFSHLINGDLMMGQMSSGVMKVGLFSSRVIRILI